MSWQKNPTKNEDEDSSLGSKGLVAAAAVGVIGAVGVGLYSFLKDKKDDTLAYHTPQPMCTYCHSIVNSFEKKVLPSQDVCHQRCYDRAQLSVKPGIHPQSDLLTNLANVAEVGMTLYAGYKKFTEYQENNKKKLQRCSHCNMPGDLSKMILVSPCGHVYHKNCFQRVGYCVACRNSIAWRPEYDHLDG